MEQLNIEGKRSGEGFVAHKAMLVNALSRAIADRVTLNDVTLGRKGLLNYFRALGGSNIVKVIPSNGSASGERATGKRLKVLCGANTSYLADSDWIGEKTPLTFCEVRVSPSNAVKPNVGAVELAQALIRVLPFTATDDSRPVLQCVKFEAKDGKLKLIGADGFRLAVITLDYADGEGQALISRDNLKGIASALKRAKRARVSFESSGESLDGVSLIIDTEIVRYKWTSVNGDYPDYPKLIPTDFNCYAHFDIVEAVKAVNSLKVIANAKAYPIDLIIGKGKVVMANPDDRGQTELSADTNGEGFIRLDGGYLAQALKACGGMVDFKLSSPVAPMLFSTNGYQLVVMPMISDKAQEHQRAQKAEQEAKQAKEGKEPKAESKAEPKSEAKAKGQEPKAEPKEAKRSRQREPVKAK